MAENELMAAYKSVPIVTRTLVTATILFSLGVAFHLVDFGLIFLDWSRIIYKFHIHRLFTSFVVTGINMSFLFDLYFLFTYGSQLENETFAGRSADFAWFVIFTCLVSSIVAYFMGLMVMFQALLLSVIYLWSQANSERIVSFMFGVRFKAVYFPWVLVAYTSIMMGAAIPWEMLTGIASAHTYYFLDSVYPAMGGPKLIPTPTLLYKLLPAQEVAGAVFTAGGTTNVFRTAQGGAAADTAGHRWGSGNRLGYAFFIYNQKGEVLISRLYRQDLKRSIADIFRIQVISNTDVRSPIITLGSTSFFHVRHENLYIVALTKWNANAALIFEFCYRVINVGRSYFGKFDEEAVKANFVLIYELLDEVLDFGYPQNSEADTLKMYITTESVKSERAVMEDSAKITIQATGATSWRRSDVKYRKNEAFIDVIESVNLLLSAQGNVLRADVAGQIMMRAYLSGTPECKFGLNDKVLLEKDPSNRRKSSNAVEIDDCQFHQCVKLGKFDSDRTISFIPPDGEFELMRYRTSDNINLPFKVHPVVIEIGKSKIEYRILVKANFSSKLYANNVVLNIPTPLNTAGVTCTASSGKAKYVPAENSIVWKIPRFQGQSEFTLTGEANLTAMTHKKAWSRPPISMDFQVLMFTSSGLLVRFLKVFEKNNYQSVKWVRYMTKAGNYQIRF
ncbi:hypothetical protein BGZ95_001179 [Linnemannia exigua]|uniref:MHD domain-containing protein n=1 Tax=Linnemannia exigua TaxID=604196 RepID=A0AAD4D9D4_9FUNG|nr:hypothetical protein BGZ95_001179 [Linnemannia exigua]